ncbi:MAG TPA: serine protease [Thermoleophilaceae bacterium]|nr:serine protease [Thermoleophilaceae bacterium]
MGRRLLPALIAAVAAAALFAAPAGAQQASPRVIGGGEVPVTAHPYQVRLLVAGVIGLSEGQCGGSIRDATHVITAAHCVTDDPGGLGLTRAATAPANVSVRYGSAEVATQSAAAVAAVTVAPQYLAGDDNYDAALVTLAQPLAGYGGPNVNRIPFAGSEELAAAVAAGGSAVASGYGVFDSAQSSTISPRLRAVTLPLRDDSVCGGYYGYGSYAPALAVCAGGTGTAATNNPDTCQGDSGGPLALSTGGVLKLAGITSRGDGCGQPGVPAVYTEAPSPAICGLLGGGGECLAKPAVPRTTAPRDTVKPSARVTSLRCRKRNCSFRVRTADKGGAVRSLTARVYRRVRICRVRGGRRSCRTVLRSKRVRTKKIPGGYSGRTKLRVARYRLDAVATDTAGNRSKTARKRFKVKKR